MMHRNTKRSLIAAACAAALLSAGPRLTRAASPPLETIQILGSTSQSGPYTSALSGLTANTAVFFQVTDVMAPTGTLVSGTNHINFESPSTDGLNNASYTLTAVSNAASFQTAALATSPNNYATPTFSSQGTLTAGAVTAVQPALALSSYDGAIAGGPAGVMQTGTMKFLANGNISVSISGSAGAGIQYNAGANTKSVASAQMSYGNLRLSTASTAVWSGQNTGSWTASDNFTNTTYADGGVTPVSFGDTDGSSNPVGTSTVGIPTGGVTPFSVAFNNTTVNYSVTAGDTTGITGATPVTLNGSGTVSFNSANTYSGATTINSGTLRANNGATGSATGASKITVAGGTLGGNGTVGTVNLSSGTITAGIDGNHAGTLNTSDTTWGSGTTDLWKLNDLGAGATGTAGTNWDLINTGELNVPSSPSSAITVKLVSAGSFTAGTAAANFGNGVYKIASVTSTDIPNVVANSTTPVILTGTNGVDNTVFALNSSAFANDTSASSDGTAYLEFIGTGTGTAGSLDLVFNTTPEPGTAILVLGAVAPMLIARRRRDRGTAEAAA